MRRRWFANVNLQIEVLSRLPTKDVLVNKCVSKEWKKLLPDCSFIKVHSMRVSEPVSGFFFQEGSQWSNPLIKSISYIPINVEVDAQVHRSVLHFLPENVVVVASTNGLICCHSHVLCPEPKIYVCNPLNKEWVSLEFPTGYTGESMALAFNRLQNPIDVSTDFKLVRVIKDHNLFFKFDVYSSRTKEWRRSAEICMSHLTLQRNHYCSYTYEGVFAEGMLFWLTGDCNQMLMFDPEKELSLVQPLPASHFNIITGMCIGESENKLHYIVVSEHGLQMWVLKDWFTSHWELKHSITSDKLEEENPELLRNLYEKGEFRANNTILWLDLMAFKDGLVVMRVSKDVLSYHFETRKLRKLVKLSRLGLNSFSPTVLPYVMGLVTVGQN